MKPITHTAWRSWLQRHAKRYTRCADEAEDVVQQALLECWMLFGYLPWERELEEDEYQRVRGWLQLKIYSLALDARKCAYRRHEVLLLDIPRIGEALANVECETEWGERLDREAFVAQLPPRLRQVLELCLEGYSYRDIAEKLAVKVGTVCGYMARVREMGRQFFGSDGNKTAFCVVIDDGSARQGVSESVTEVDADETTQSDVVESDSAVDSESDSVAKQLQRPRRTERGGGNVAISIPTQNGCGCGKAGKPIPLDPKKLKAVLRENQAKVTQSQQVRHRKMWQQTQPIQPIPAMPPCPDGLCTREGPYTKYGCLEEKCEDQEGNEWANTKHMRSKFIWKCSNGLEYVWCTGWQIMRGHCCNRTNVPGCDEGAPNQILCNWNGVPSLD